MKKLFLFVFLFALSLVSCTVTVNKMPQSINENSFVMIMDRMTIKECSSELNMCAPMNITVSGSAFVISNIGNDSIGITAGHVCDSAPGSSILKKNVTATTFSGKKYDIEVMKVYRKSDICVIKIKDVRLEPMSVAPYLGEMPHGSKVYTIAAPLGIHGKGMALVLDGYYSGVDPQMGFDAYTIPTKGGSSGAPIFNERGSVVGVISMRRIGFENLCLSPPHRVVSLILNNAKHGLFPLE